MDSGHGFDPILAPFRRRAGSHIHRNRGRDFDCFHARRSNADRELVGSKLRSSERLHPVDWLDPFLAAGRWRPVQDVRPKHWDDRTLAFGFARRPILQLRSRFHGFRGPRSFRVVRRRDYAGKCKSSDRRRERHRECECAGRLSMESSEPRGLDQNHGAK